MRLRHLNFQYLMVDLDSPAVLIICVAHFKINISVYIHTLVQLCSFPSDKVNLSSSLRIYSLLGRSRVPQMTILAKSPLYYIRKQKEALLESFSKSSKFTKRPESDVENCDFCFFYNDSMPMMLQNSAITRPTISGNRFHFNSSLVAWLLQRGKGHKCVEKCERAIIYPDHVMSTLKQLTRKPI